MGFIYCHVHPLFNEYMKGHQCKELKVARCVLGVLCKGLQSFMNLQDVSCKNFLVQRLEVYPNSLFSVDKVWGSVQSSLHREASPLSVRSQETLDICTSAALSLGSRYVYDVETINVSSLDQSVISE